MAPAFSVIVPTHGRQELLDEALDSLMRQTLDDFECIVVDDGSPESVRAPADPRFRVVRRKARGGPAAARNMGIAAAAGQYVAFLDSDDLYMPRRLELAAAGHARAPLVVCWQTFLGPHSGRALRRRLEGITQDHILEATTPAMGAVSVERGRCIPLDESYRACEDLDWWLRQTADTEVTTVPEIAYLVRRHNEPRDAGPAERAEFSRQLLAEHDEYFATHRKARAFRLFRIAVLERRNGDARAALRAAWQSVRVWPRPRVALTLARTLAATTLGRSPT